MTEPSTPLPAHSDDGRSFTVPDAAGTPFIAGTLLLVTTGQGRQLALVEARETAAPGAPEALHGRLLGAIEGDRFDPRASHPFADAAVEAADAETIDLVHAALGATLEVGVNLSPPIRPARLLAHRFNRHTFWCGQSGSGKTYALGVVLEQLIAHTALPVVVFDPNSDFVRLGELNPDASGPGAELLRQRDIRVLRPNTAGADPLRARFTAMTAEAKAAVLRLDPVVDREEFNAAVHLRETLSEVDPGVLLPELLGSDNPVRRALGLRIENMGLLSWEVWAGRDREATRVIDERADATVLDLGGFSTPDQHLVVALSVLDELWTRREERRPVLLVIDEAHNLCSPELSSPLAVAVRERIIQIAAEGRKFGLWLLLSTQRPSKVHPGIISQCDNLALMKMSSPVDLDGLATYFGYAPAALIARSPWFRQGEALFAGGFVPAPTLLAMNARLTPEGGSDVGVPLR
ncbi:ATP-binding protein [Agromyces badenianii]|uniref:ATP-binding protein n=1 Tax=Agromyces badenianii TaxID=2080742 RepID=UPI000D58CA30|nr:ATP-binding protein [Agromyces badenianii]PWC03596.1 ATP-binding protein [Agromyces badenianii]